MDSPPVDNGAPSNPELEGESSKPRKTRKKPEKRVTVAEYNAQTPSLPLRPQAVVSPHFAPNRLPGKELSWSDQKIGKISFRFAPWYEHDLRRLEIRVYQRIGDHPDKEAIKQKHQNLAFMKHGSNTGQRGPYWKTAIWQYGEGQEGDSLTSLGGSDYWATILRNMPPAPHVDLDEFFNSLVRMSAGISPSSVNGITRLYERLTHIFHSLCFPSASKVDNARLYKSISEINVPTPGQLEAYRLYGDTASGIGYFPQKLEILLVGAGLLWLVQHPDDRCIPPFWKNWLAAHSTWAKDHGFPFDPVEDPFFDKTKEAGAAHLPSFRPRYYTIHPAYPKEYLTRKLDDLSLPPRDELSASPQRPAADNTRDISPGEGQRPVHYHTHYHNHNDTHTHTHNHNDTHTHYGPTTTTATATDER